MDTPLINPDHHTGIGVETGATAELQGPQVALRVGHAAFFSTSQSYQMAHTKTQPLAWFKSGILVTGRAGW